MEVDSNVVPKDCDVKLVELEKFSSHVESRSSKALPTRPLRMAARRAAIPDLFAVIEAPNHPGYLRHQRVLIEGPGSVLRAVEHGEECPRLRHIDESAKMTIATDLRHRICQLPVRCQTLFRSIDPKATGTPRKGPSVNTEGIPTSSSPPYNQ